MLKTLDQLHTMANGKQKDAYYELYHLNNELNKQGYKCDLLKQSADYTDHLAVTIQPIENNDYCWYSATNDGGKVETFKNWDGVYNFVHGMRMVYYYHLNK